MEISNRKPKSIDDLVNIMLFHFSQGISLPSDKAFSNNRLDTNRGKVITPDLNARKRVIKNKYFEADRIEKKKRLVRLILASLTFLIVPTFVYISFSGNLPYYLNNTVQTKAEVVNTRPFQIIGRHKIYVKYFYEVKGHVYEGTFKQTKSFHHVPLLTKDSLVIEYLENDPSTSRPISVHSVWSETHPNKLRPPSSIPKKSN
ncbi:hypothetical protein [Halocola ammonii]